MKTDRKQLEVAPRIRHPSTRHHSFIHSFSVPHSHEGVHRRRVGPRAVYIAPNLLYRVLSVGAVQVNLRSVLVVSICPNCAREALRCLRKPHVRCLLGKNIRTARSGPLLSPPQGSWTSSYAAAGTSSAISRGSPVSWRGMSLAQWLNIQYGHCSVSLKINSCLINVFLDRVISWYRLFMILLLCYYSLVDCVSFCVFAWRGTGCGVCAVTAYV